MKVILSRKGFDSSNGKIASPIFEDGTMCSFPIPSEEKDKYSDLQQNGIPYSKILSDLNYDDIPTCHLDPDLDQGRRKKPVPNWVPAFGQTGSSATYLDNCGVSKGDLFLFFGTFHHVEEHNGHFRYTRNSGDFYKDNPLHVIWGYLQVGDVIEDFNEMKKLKWHPHSAKWRSDDDQNVIYVASDRLSFDKSKPGAGLLTFDPKRVLTLENCSRATWKKNKVYDPDHIEGDRKNSAKNPRKGLYYSGVWQELVLAESVECTNWARSIIR